MAIKTTKAFLDLLAKSKLLTDEEFAKARAVEAPPDQPRELAKVLVLNKMLTRWQAGQLLAGRSSFFLGKFKYKLIDLLGRGGMGSVFLAQHTTMNRPVALKIISKQLGRDPQSLERFFVEARAIAALDHPNIVHAYSIDNEGDRYFIVMEFVEGKNLEQIVKAKGPLDYSSAADCVRQAAEGLEHAHSRNMIHCDVKPANLLVNRQGVVKILDMGMARAVGPTEDSDAAPEERVLGTVDYLAPEQALESPQFDHRADVYSLGCTLYFLLTGHPPFPDGTLHERILKHQTEEPKPVDADRPGAPAELVAICSKMMAKDPADRYQTAGEVAGLLAAWGSAASKSAEPAEEEELAEVIPAMDDPATTAAGAAPAKGGGGPVAAFRNLCAERPKAVLFSGAGAVLGLAVIVGLVVFLTSSGDRPPGGEVATAAGATETSAPAPAKATPVAEKQNEGDWPDVGIPDIEFDPTSLDAPGASDAGDSGKPKAADAAKPDSDGPSKANLAAEEPAAGETSPDNSKPDDPKPDQANSDQPPAAPMQKEKPEPKEEPAEASAAADKPAEEPAADKPKSEPAEKPKPKPPPKKAPFADFPELVELPECNSEPPSPIELGKVHSAPDDNWQILLGGADKALRSTRQMTRKFVVDQAESASGTARWAIQLEEASSGGETKTAPVAELRRAGETLTFQWASDADPAAANYLRNCVLQIRVAGDSHYVELLRPVLVEPITIDLLRPATVANASAKYLPEDSNLRLAITRVEGRDEFRVDPAEPAAPGPPVTLRFERTDRHGNTRDWVDLRLGFSARSSGLNCKVQLMVDPPTRELFRKLQTLPGPGGLNMARNQIDMRKNEVLKKLEPKDKDKAPKGEQRTMLNRQIDELEKMNWYIDFFEQVHQKAKIHYELYTEVDGRKLVLIATGADEPGEAAAAEAK